MMRNDQENARREEDEDDYEDSYAEDSEEEDDEYDYEYDESDDYSDEDEEDLRSTGGSQHRTTVDGGDDEIRDSEARGSSDPIGTRGASTTFRARPEVPVIPLGGQRVIPRAVSWPGSKPEEDPPVGETSIKSVLRRSLTEPDNRINKSVSFSEDPEVNEFSALSDALQVDVDSPRADSSDHSPARANPYSNMPVEELCLLSQHLNAELSLLSQMDPEALAPDDGAAFSPSRIPITPTEMESPQEVRNETDAPTCEEESERVEPIQESENQLPEVHESVAAMAETGTDVSREGGQAKPKVVHTVVALGPGPLNQEAATSSASSYSGHAFSSGLPGKAVPEMAPLSKVSQASDASEEVPQATGPDGLGDEDVALPECASLFNVLEAKEDGKDEKDEKDEEKEEGKKLAASFVAGAFAASDAEQPKAEPADGACLDGEDALETLHHAPPESESNGQQHSDSDVQIDDSPAVQHRTLLENVVKQTNSKEEMAAKMQEKEEKQEKQEKQEPEGLLAPGLLQALLATFCCCGTRQREA